MNALQMNYYKTLYEILTLKTNLFYFFDNMKY